MKQSAVLVTSLLLLLAMQPAITAQTGIAQELVDGDRATTERLSVSDPIGGAVAISQARFPSGAPASVVLATTNGFADALAAAPLLGQSPLLLTPTDVLALPVVNEIRRLLPDGGEVILLGGTEAISATVETQLQTEGYQTVRLAGPDRIGTAVEVAREHAARTGSGDLVAVARAFGEGSAGWADSITVGGWLANTNTPLVLTPTDTVDPRVAALLAELGTQQTLIVGGTAALSAEVQATLGGVRVAGSERAGTAAAIAAERWGSAAGYLVVNGYRDDGWAYGLAAAGLSADLNYPILVADADRVPDATLGRVGRGCGTDPALETLLICDEALLSATVVSDIDQQDGGACPPPPPPSEMDLAFALPGSRMYYFDDCPPPPASPLIPPTATCVSVLAIDLDGDGTGPGQIDRVIMYQEPDEFLTVRGFSTRRGVLRPYRTEIYVPGGDLSSAGYALECAVDLDVGPATEILLTTSVGANTIFGEILEVREGGIQATLDGDSGFPFYWSFGGGVRFGSGYGVAPNNFTQYIYDDTLGTPYGWEAYEYVLTGGAFTLRATASGTTDGGGPYGWSGCPGGTGTFPPGIGRQLPPEARQPGTGLDLPVRRGHHR